uniref:Uncharacterized protein n=1 Tax=Rhizophora mucronata TaxID=61149 RepID=A0A2P2J1A7_RHIMU
MVILHGLDIQCLQLNNVFFKTNEE